MVSAVSGGTGVDVGVTVGVAVGSGVEVFVGVGVSLGVGVLLGVNVSVLVGSGVSLAVGVNVFVGSGVLVNVLVGCGVLVLVGGTGVVVSVGGTGDSVMVAVSLGGAGVPLGGIGVRLGFGVVVAVGEDDGVGVLEGSAVNVSRALVVAWTIALAVAVSRGPGATLKSRVFVPVDVSFLSCTTNVCLPGASFNTSSVKL